MSTPREQGIALLKRPYGREIANIASSYTSVFFWFTPGVDPEINHGCIFFLDLGRGTFGVTANHAIKPTSIASQEIPNSVAKLTTRHSCLKAD